MKKILILAMLCIAGAQVHALKMVAPTNQKLDSNKVPTMTNEASTIPKLPFYGSIPNTGSPYSRPSGYSSLSSTTVPKGSMY